jgi:hypothetical protein
MKALSSFEMSVLTRATWRNTQEDGIPYENFHCGILSTLSFSVSAKYSPQHQVLKRLKSLPFSQDANKTSYAYRTQGELELFWFCSLNC